MVCGGGIPGSHECGPPHLSHCSPDGECRDGQDPNEGMPEGEGEEEDPERELEEFSLVCRTCCACLRFEDDCVGVCVEAEEECPCREEGVGEIEDD